MIYLYQHSMPVHILKKNINHKRCFHVQFFCHGVGGGGEREMGLSSENFCAREDHFQMFHNKTPIGAQKKKLICCLVNNQSSTDTFVRILIIFELDGP